METSRLFDRRYPTAMISWFQATLVTAAGQSFHKTVNGAAVAPATLGPGEPAGF